MTGPFLPGDLRFLGVLEDDGRLAGTVGEGAADTPPGMFCIERGEEELLSIGQPGCLEGIEPLRRDAGDPAGCDVEKEDG